MNLGILAYVPPPRIGNPEVFRANLDRFQSKHRLLLYSDFEYPGMIKLKGSPEMVKGSANTFAVNNLIFYTGLRIAIRHELDYFIYLESDCRVGREQWDETMFDQFFGRHQACAFGGTLVTYNPCNAGWEAYHRWAELMGRNERRNFPVACYGFKGAADNSGSSVFPNGALGIYSVAWLRELFTEQELNQTGSTGGPGADSLAYATYAWDFEIGNRLWKKMGAQAYDVLAHLDCVYSGYGENLTSEDQRLEWLRTGKLVAVHQVKSGRTI